MIRRFFRSLSDIITIQGGLILVVKAMLGWNLPNPLSGFNSSSGGGDAIGSYGPVHPVASYVSNPPHSYAGSSYAAPAAALPPPVPSGPPPTLADSPTYQAFLRSLGLEESQANTSTQDRIDALRRDFNRNWAEIGQAGDYTRQGISGNLESRGLYQSGELEQALAHQRAAEDQQVSNLRGSADDQINLLGNDLARRIADINLRKANATLGAAGDVYQLPS